MRNYDSSQVQVIFLTSNLTDGLSAGAFVTWQDSTKNWNYLPDGLGGGIRSFNSSVPGEIQVTLDVESTEHSLLLFYLQYDRAAKNLVGPFIIFDQSSGEKIVFNNAYITGPPAQSRATESLPAVWTFQYSSQEHFPSVLNRNLVGS